MNNISTISHPWRSGVRDSVSNLSVDSVPPTTIHSAIHADPGDAFASQEAGEAGDAADCWNLPAIVLSHLQAISGRLDTGGRVVEARGDGLARRGISPHALLGQRFEAIFPESRGAIARASEGARETFVISGAAGECARWFAEFLVFADSENPGCVGFFARDVTARKELERQAIDAADAEQRRIGAELHDNLGQQLTGIACLGTALRERLRGIDQDAAADADALVGIANEALQQTRSLARTLHPSCSGSQDLVALLDQLSERIWHLHGVKFELHVHGERRRYDDEASLNLLRITQEAVSNALRHGGAKKIDVTLDTTCTPHRLVIQDDGSGFDQGSLESTGVGLHSMKYRADLLGGTLAITSTPGEGTRVECCLGATKTGDDADLMFSDATVAVA